MPLSHRGSFLNFVFRAWEISIAPLLFLFAISIIPEPEACWFVFFESLIGFSLMQCYATVLILFGVSSLLVLNICFDVFPVTMG